MNRAGPHNQAEVPLNWDDLRFVLALRRAGSLSAAARVLEVEPSTASRRLGALEKALGAQLAARTPEGLVMNDAGELAADLAETIDTGVQQLVRRVGGEDARPEGTVRLATTGAFVTFLMRGLSEFAEAHPKIHIEIVTSSAALDLTRREADVALRLFREQSLTLVSRKIGEVGWSVYAAERYVERTQLRTGAEPDERLLLGQSVVGYGGPASRSLGATWLSQHSRKEEIVLLGDSVLSVTNAVSAGMGVSVLPCFVAHADPTLVRLTPTVVATTETFIVIPPDHRNTARVRIVTDALAALFARERMVLSGVV
jgi:DNA-binding transcriptional LysR family regulator